MAPMIRMVRVFALVFVMLCLLGGCEATTTPNADPQLWPLGGAEEIEALAARDDVNVLFILVDTLRALSLIHI